MAALVNPHWEAVTPDIRNLLPLLGRAADLEPFYLAGGTALALRIGHRISVDLDFFGMVEDFDAEWQRRIGEQLATKFRVHRENYTPFGLNMVVEGVYVGLLTYGYAMLDPLDTVADIKVAGFADIGWMKLEAIVDRGARKDFYDLYFIAQHVSLDMLFERRSEKYPYWQNFAANVLSAMTDFDIADTQEDPNLLVPITWPQVKEFFEQEFVRLSDKWLNKK